MSSGKVQPISPAEAMLDITLPDDLTFHINAAIRNNLTVGVEKSSTFYLDSMVTAFNASVESSEQIVLSEMLCFRISAVYSAKGWKVTWQNKEVDRNEWATEMTFLGLESAPA